MPILPQDECAAILQHYIKTLTERAGLRWTEANDRDFSRLADLFIDTAPTELDTIPPYQPIVSDRQTIVLERDGYGDPQFERWRAERRADTDDAAMRRMFERERGGR